MGILARHAWLLELRPVRKGIRVPSPLSSGEKVAARPDEGLCPPPRCRRMSMLSEIPHLFEEVVSPNFPRSVEIRDGRKVVFRVFEVDFSRLQCFGIRNVM